MISGVIISYKASEFEFPIDLAVRSWMEVCDEIVIMTFTDDPDISRLLNMTEWKCERCVIKVRAVNGPKCFELLRLYGYFFTGNPDWVVHFDSDYLISPEQAFKLRNTIKSAPDDTDVITYRLVCLNRGVNRLVHNKDLAKWTVPFDGIRGEYPLIVNPGRQAMIVPFEGIVEDNFYVNFEGMISLNRRHWGKALFPKMSGEGIDPYLENRFGFGIVRSNVDVEHLSFSLPDDKLKKKMSHPYWVNLGIDVDHVVKGQQDYSVTYPILEQARKRFS